MRHAPQHLDETEQFDFSGQRWPTVDVRGLRIPRLGFGTWQLKGQGCEVAVARALELGYRHIDTAQMYGNEGKIGGALRRSAVPREQLWITTKIAPDHAQPDMFRKSLHDSLKRLGQEYVDLLLLHWPVEDVPLERTLEEMTRALDHGLTRSIGVSNFTLTLLEKAMRLAPIAALQVEMHPFLNQQDLLRHCQKNNILFTAYSPLARGKVNTDSTLASIAERYGATPSQICLAWALSKANVAVIPKASSLDHQKENIEALDLVIKAKDLRQIDLFERGERLINPDFAPRWDNPTQVHA